MHAHRGWGTALAWTIELDKHKDDPDRVIRRFGHWQRGLHAASPPRSDADIRHELEKIPLAHENGAPPAKATQIDDGSSGKPETYGVRVFGTNFVYYIRPPDTIIITNIDV